jgi:NAD(P)-dependent dehydrogenase (short-subunit alcohol dehydrogenase family)
LAKLTRPPLISIIPLQGDITKKEDLKLLAERVKADAGYVNLLVANAGMTGPGLEKLKPRYTLSDYVEHAWNVPVEEFTSVYDLNCTAVYYTVLAFLELLDEGNRRKTYLKSQVIATASTASFLRNPRAGYAYCSSKAALVSMMKCFSTFCVPWGIRFNVIAAGRKCKIRLCSAKVTESCVSLTKMQFSLLSYPHHCLTHLKFPKTKQ